MKEESTELLPPEGDKDLGKKIFSILEEVLSDKAAKGLPEKWVRAAELTKNKHWKAKSGKPGMISANLLFTHRQRTVAMLTDNNPTFNVSNLGGSEKNQEGIDLMLKTCEYWWGEYEQQTVFSRSVGSAEEAGAVCEKVIFNPELEQGGEVETIRPSLFNVGFYPIDCTDAQKADAVLHYYSMPLRKVRRMWGDKAKNVKPDEDILESIGDLRREISSGSAKKDSGYMTTFSNVIKQILNLDGKSKEDDKEGQVLIVETWAKDYTTIPDGEPVEDENGEIKQAYIPKYIGNIRRVQTCNAGEIILSDMSNPSINPNLTPEEYVNCYLYDKYPFSMTPSISDEVSIWGMSDYEQLEQLQIEINKSLSQMTINKDRASRNKLINPKTSGVPNEHFDNKSGIIQPSSAIESQGIRYMENPKLDPEIANLMSIYRELFFQVAGSFDLEQGQSAGKNVIAYKAIAALLERAATMHKDKIRNYSKMVRERGRMFVSLAQNWYTEDRWITYEDDEEDVSRQVNYRQLLFPSKLTVISGSTMPRARVQEREEAIELFQLGAIDYIELLKKLDWSGRKEVIKRKEAGPMGDLLGKLQSLQAPDPMLQLIQDIAQMDPKDFEKAMKAGQLPSIPQMLRKLAMNMMGTQDPQAAALENEAAANAAKIQSEIALNKEKVKSEQVKQIVSAAGIQFDAETIKQNWATIEASIKDQKAKNILGAYDTAAKVATSKNKAYNEKGMKSNNKE